MATEAEGWAARYRGGDGFAIEPALPGDGALAPGDVRLAFRVGGICGSDIGMLRSGQGTAGEPGGPLHEIVGTVLDGGDTGIETGATVVGWAGDYRGLAARIDCRAAQLAVVPAALADLPRVAIVAQPLACVLCAMERIGVTAGRTVLVLGAGSVGLLFAAEAASAGAVVTLADRVDREALARDFGATEFVRGDVRDAGLLAGRTFDLVVEAIGHDPAAQSAAARFVAQDGTLYLFGVPDEAELVLPFQALFYRNARILTGITTEHRRHLVAALERLDDSRYREAYVTDVFPLAAVQAAYQRAMTDDSTRIKVLIDAES